MFRYQDGGEAANCSLRRCNTNAGQVPAPRRGLIFKQLVPWRQSGSRGPEDFG
ncbi:Uncharacterized protein pbN1_15990 [Aromatoleum bremense]|nr:Uncharacterized protein pbN1_15990 [Aromatoleum bremense]